MNEDTVKAMDIIILFKSKLFERSKMCDYTNILVYSVIVRIQLQIELNKIFRPELIWS